MDATRDPKCVEHFFNMFNLTDIYVKEVQRHRDDDTLTINSIIQRNISEHDSSYGIVDSTLSWNNTFHGPELWGNVNSALNKYLTLMANLSDLGFDIETLVIPTHSAIKRNYNKGETDG